MAGRPVLHPHRQVPPGDVHGGRRPPAAAADGLFPTAAPLPNYFRFRIMPRQTIAFGVTAMDEADQMIGQRAELVASRQPGADEKAAYERVLSDALEGDATLFARMDYVEEAWRIVDPVLAMNTPVREYEPGTWGPERSCDDIAPPGGWANPTTGEERVVAWLTPARRRRGESAELTRLEARTRVGLALATVGAVPQRAAVGDGARGLQPGRRRVGVLHPRSRAIARLSLGRGRARRLLRPEAATVFRAGALEREGPDSEGAAVRLEQRRGEPRRGREGVLLLSRFHADPLVHEVALQVPAGARSRTTIS